MLRKTLMAGAIWLLSGTALAAGPTVGETIHLPPGQAAALSFQRDDGSVGRCDAYGTLVITRITKSGHLVVTASEMEVTCLDKTAVLPLRQYEWLMRTIREAKAFSDDLSGG